MSASKRIVELFSILPQIILLLNILPPIILPFLRTT